MSSVEPSSASRPLRVAGLAALGVAAVALVLGVVTLFANGSEDPQNGAQPGPTSSTASDPGQPTTSGEPAPPTSTSAEPPPSTTPSSEPPPSTSAQPPPVTSAQPPPAQPKAAVRVYNNSNIKNLADHAATDLRNAGYPVDEVGNYSSGVIPTTTVYYRPGTDEEAAAKALARSFGIRAEARFEGLKDAKPGLIMIVTREYKAGSGKDGGNAK
ncbi:MULTISPECIES: LytR C-terminal domain-containing protein [unclassified Crossiella]|uniref:LytR C-terminal domain-containing protein n=1 Tax=unclassified Crossiella TaxID=2620835 RepID=UPI001FFF2BFE|nr:MULTISPECIES: LytR C-terminal domain-containing protein [unclassified Crossiella]MCK2237904.1 LytR C-terminal domain-containing protein [Crossiella sp. S99.2]MCK2255190.1 LytR C-terminal domain-containing protein [Crossiella sp. S99.1]